MKQDLLMIAEALGYRKIERLRNAEEKISNELLLDVLKASISEPYAILFFPGKCFQITPFGMSFAHAASLLRACDNYLIAFPDLEEKFLRQAFTGFELLLYKTCHIVLEKSRPDYHFETEKTRQRIVRLQSVLSLADWEPYARLFDEIFFVRDAFAHSFIPLADIKYAGVPLSECFGSSFIGHTRRNAEAYGRRIFMDDLDKLYAPIMDLFREHQLKQVDAEKFHKLCDRLLMARSLSPGP
jgi:hypothetical protein